MVMAELSLIQYNIDGALDNILAMEEHLSENSKGVPHQWCQNKHGRITSSHHLRELIEHSDRTDSQLAKNVRTFKSKFDEERRKPKPDLDKIRQLRNEFREIIHDPSLSGTTKSCGVCALDRRKGGQKARVNEPAEGLSLYSGGALSTTKTVSESNKKGNGALWVVGTAIAVGAILYITLKKK
ncbi:MAG: hypothetical protein Q8O68_00705 [Candidatus Daviesbacteria bacterium]|nr:hypothetical protein [Candidatus Daviesbacteria bacterium]